MAKKRKIQAKVAKQESIAEGIYSMWLSFPQEYNIAEMAVPGQFISLYCLEGSRLLPRPISICELDPERVGLRIVYRIAGAGTREFAQLQAGETVEVLGPLGNGYTCRDGRAILVGGGIGIPPMLQLAKTLCQRGCEVQAVLGYQDADLFLKEELEAYGTVYVSTEDGSVGTRGNVIDAIEAEQVTGDTIYACGPLPMLRGVKEYARAHQIEAQISLEERMACGIGACLGCVCQTKERDAHSNVYNKRICKDGPVFDAEEIEF